MEKRHCGRCCEEDKISDCPISPDNEVIEMKELNFKSEVDGKEFKIEISEDLEDGFVKINDKLVVAEEITNEPPAGERAGEVMDKGELVYTIPEIYDLYYYEGNFYDFYWDTASGCIFCKLIE